MSEAAAESLSVTGLLDDPSASSWLKSALRSALERDVVDALNDALVLAEVLDVQLRLRLGIDESSPPVEAGSRPPSYVSK